MNAKANAQTAYEEAMAMEQRRKAAEAKLATLPVLQQLAVQKLLEQRQESEIKHQETNIRIGMAGKKLEADLALSAKRGEQAAKAMAGNLQLNEYWTQHNAWRKANPDAPISQWFNEHGQPVGHVTTESLRLGNPQTKNDVESKLDWRDLSLADTALKELAKTKAKLLSESTPMDSPEIAGINQAISEAQAKQKAAVENIRAKANPAKKSGLGTAQAPTAYKVGAIYKGGLKFLGGNPSDPNSWEKTR
jgi:hypothetical protein